MHLPIWFLFAALVLLVIVVGFEVHRFRRRDQPDLLVVRGHHDDVLASASVRSMRRAYAEAGRPIPVILKAPDHIRVERLKSL